MTAVDATTAGVGADPISIFGPVAAPRAVWENVGTTVAPRVLPALERRRLWERRYSRLLALTDSVIVLLVSALPGALDLLLTPVVAGDVLNVARVTALTTPVWLVMLAAFHTRSTQIVGSGSTEYKRVAHATGFAFGILAILFIVFQWQGVREQLIVALPIGLVGLLVGRWSWRKWLIRQRRFGHYATRTLIAGKPKDVEYVIRSLTRDGNLGYTVLGAATTQPTPDELTVDGRAYRVVGTMDTVAVHARELGADSIVVASRPDDDPDFIRRLSWDLEGTAAELILSSPLTDVAGPRISLRPIDGLPLIHVRIPTFEGGIHMLKRAMDVFVAILALIPVAMVTPLIALLIKLDDGGPTFFHQVRIGRDGREFRILKFRTMRTTAEQELAALRDANEGSGPLFKLKRDPRITRVGAVLRKFSLDELPQFWNVLRGEMSVVGPRPPLPSEITAYDGTVYRRLYIKPGITGLWQVSGRSDLSWDESVRLDLRYVENWSVMSDLMIMWRTAQAMVRPKGAY
ncbi:sugar transferase [Micromonospora sp. DT81.3]|uniref:sugar transferase n=1 Tax=Micromonospora sp. DT81.3 TaxID=3416523 RepID=UPI003CF91EFB